MKIYLDRTKTKKMMRKQKTTQDALAEKMDCSARSIGRYVAKTGQHPISYDSLESMAQILGCGIADLLPSETIEGWQEEKKALSDAYKTTENRRDILGLLARNGFGFDGIPISEDALDLLADLLMDDFIHSAKNAIMLLELGYLQK